MDGIVYTNPKVTWKDRVDMTLMLQQKLLKSKYIVNMH
jgi:hypothetical protein